jgi:hypothetical protein
MATTEGTKVLGEKPGLMTLTVTVTNDNVMCARVCEM